MHDDYMWRGETDLIQVQPAREAAWVAHHLAACRTHAGVCPSSQLYWTQLTRFWDNCLSHVDPTTGLWLTSQVLADIRVRARWPWFACLAAVEAARVTWRVGVSWPQVGVHCPNNQCTSGIVTPWIIERLQWSAAMAAAVGNTTMQVRR